MFEMTPEQATVFMEPTRTDIMMLLAERPATTSQLADALDKPKGTVGHHVKALEESGLVEVVETRQVRALTEKYYGRLAKTYLFPSLEHHSGEGNFLQVAIGEMREPTEDEDGFLTIRHARIPEERVRELSLRLLDLAEEFAAQERGGNTTYGLLLGLYPTDRPSLKEDE